MGKISLQNSLNRLADDRNGWSTLLNTFGMKVTAVLLRKGESLEVERRRWRITLRGTIRENNKKRFGDIRENEVQYIESDLVITSYISEKKETADVEEIN